MTLVTVDHRLSLSLYHFAERHTVVRHTARFCASVLIWVLATAVITGLAITSPLVGLPVLVGAFFLGHIINAVVEHYRWRERPYKTHIFEPLIATRWLHGSFPSDHAMMAFVLAGVWTGMGETLTVIAILVAVLIGVGRIAVGVHYVSDVVVGAFVGMVSAAAFTALF